jgi:hypothetical protein
LYERTLKEEIKINVYFLEKLEIIILASITKYFWLPIKGFSS